MLYPHPIIFNRLTRRPELDDRTEDGMWLFCCDGWELYKKQKQEVSEHVATISDSRHMYWYLGSLRVLHVPSCVNLNPPTH